MDESQAKEPPTPITRDDLAEYFKEKKINADCRRCPITSWEVLDEEDARGAVMQTLNNRGDMSSAWLLPVIPLICKNCADVWLIARVGYENWLKERNSAGPE